MKDIKVFGGRYGLGGKELTPNCVLAVLENLKDILFNNLLPTTHNFFKQNSICD